MQDTFQFPQSLDGPVALIHSQQAIRNIRKMAAKASANACDLRPHFKTHQSHVVAEWFRDQGVKSCTVSSPAMAEFFAAEGWDDILIAIPSQTGAIPTYQKLAENVKLSLLAEDTQIVPALDVAMDQPWRLWLEIDAGYGRTGIPWNDTSMIDHFMQQVADVSGKIKFQGILTHAGDGYSCQSIEEIRIVADRYKNRMLEVSAHIRRRWKRSVKISYGDTPTCSTAEDLSAYDELRPGNFVFYDLMQLQLGACTLDEIALTMACPVMASYPERGEVVLHAGAVHFSKESIDGHYGRAIQRDTNGQPKLIEGVKITGLSQEHAIVQGPREWAQTVGVSDVLEILPVHSCLTMDCMRHRPSGVRIL